MKKRIPLRKQPGQRKLKQEKGDPNGNKSPNFINREKWERELIVRCQKFLEQKNVNTEGMTLKELIHAVKTQS
jgi:hypothetical protein